MVFFKDINENGTETLLIVNTRTVARQGDKTLTPAKPTKRIVNHLINLSDTISDEAIQVDSYSIADSLIKLSLQINLKELKKLHKISQGSDGFDKNASYKLSLLTDNAIKLRKALKTMEDDGDYDDEEKLNEMARMIVKKADTSQHIRNNASSGGGIEDHQDD